MSAEIMDYEDTGVHNVDSELKGLKFSVNFTSMRDTVYTVHNSG